jgi:RNA polymerase sigma factor (sigma-70 family)
LTQEPDRDDDRNEVVTRWAVQYHDALKAYFFRRIRDWSEAEDLTQDLFLRGIRMLDTSQVENPEAFLFHVANNILKDRLRRKYTVQAYLDQVRPEAERRVDEITPEQQLEAKQALAKALGALGGVDDRVREVFLLHKVKGLTHPEIAGLYGISVSSVEKYIIKCIAILAAHLAKQRE